MRYWWVNQNQTYDQEIAGGYLWSPKRKADGGRNPFYESMREVSPGDIILSFVDTYIRSVGIAQSYCYECPKPIEFGETGAYWEQIGWKVDVYYRSLVNQVRPREHIERLAPLLPEKYSPLQASGHGNQGVYLTELSPQLMGALADLIGREIKDLLQGVHIADSVLEHREDRSLGIEQWEQHIQQEIQQSPALEETEKEALVMSRRGQGQFRRAVGEIERRCRITLVDRPEHLRASHIKPWRDSTNEERLDGQNGFLLTPSIDHLFDRGFISFENNGALLLSPVAHKPSLQRMGVASEQAVNVGGFTDQQKNYLDFHRNFVFLESRNR